MNFRKLALNLMFWCAIALVFGFAVRTLAFDFTFSVGTFNFNVDSGMFINLALIIVMTLSLDKMKFDKNRIFNKRTAVDSIILTFGLNMAVTLIFGLIILPFSKDAFYGYAILASVPCAVSVIAITALCDNNLDTAVAAVTVSYVTGILFTTLISYILIGDVVNPLSVMSLVFVYIVVPIFLMLLIKKIRIGKDTRQIIINLMLAVVMFLSVNKNRNSIFDNIEVSLVLIVFAAARVVVLHYATRLYVLKRKIAPESRMTFLVLGVWKNTSMAIAMCISLLGDYPLAAVACVVALIVEDVWFSWVTDRKDAVFGKREEAAGLT